MPGDAHFLDLPNEAATVTLGGVLADVLAAGDIVALKGDLGTGKSVLARAIVRAMCNDESLEVLSPTFTLVQAYRAEAAEILHADLYRLGDAREIDELGLFDEPDAIALVEWPERAPELAKRASLTVALDMVPEGPGRRARLDFAGSDRGFPARAKLAGLFPAAIEL